jgi:alkylmercury lyase
MQMRVPDVRALADEFTRAHVTLSEPEQRIAVAAFRRLAEGTAFEPEELAEPAGLPAAEVRAAFDRWPEVHHDQDGRVEGFWGLTVRPTRHLIEIDGRTLYTWCAFDTLFIPEILGRPARVRSTSPLGDERITLSVDARGPRDVEPEGAVMSMHRVTEDFSLEDVVGTFCCYVHFFASEDAARTWAAKNDATYVLSIPEGFEVGRHYVRGHYGVATT